jgi:hypothetical protein
MANPLTVLSIGLHVGIRAPAATAASQLRGIRLEIRWCIDFDGEPDLAADPDRRGGRLPLDPFDRAPLGS